MDRIYDLVVEEHFKSYRQMLFLVGPRQAGKTTVSLHQKDYVKEFYYFNWDNHSHRKMILDGPQAIANEINLEKIRKTSPMVIFDEIQKYSHWKDFLKGMFDTCPNQIEVLVTGSARLDLFRATGDSLMGRYFSYTLHPLTVAEIIEPQLRDKEINPFPKKIASSDFQNLINFGGFPEPFLMANNRFYQRWKTLRLQQLFQEDLREMSRIQELGQISILGELLRSQVGQQTNYTSLAKKINVSVDTIKRWLEVLKGFYYCFMLRPWTTNITRSILKEPKIYLWDWSLVENEGSRLENMVASHLFKFVNFWRDRGFGEYDLFYLRDKEKREVDFLVTKNNNPWFLVEVKKSLKNGISSSLYYFQALCEAEHAFQIGFDSEFVERNCFEFTKPILVPAQTFLSQLV